MSIQYSPSTRQAMERIATAPRTSEQGRSDEYQRGYEAGRDDQLKECCEKLREQFDGLGRSRSKGLAAWLREQCRPPKRLDLRDQLLTLLEGCGDAPETIDLRKRVEALPRGLTVGTIRLATANGEIYRFTTVNGVVTIERISTRDSI